MEMNDTAKMRIETTVRKFLQESDSDLYQVRTRMARTHASKELNMDLSLPPYKEFVDEIIYALLEEMLGEEKPLQKEDDEDDGFVICELSETRFVAVHDFKGEKLVSIRDCYQKNGNHFPTTTGINLTKEQWSAFKNNVPAIEEAIKEMESRGI